MSLEDVPTDAPDDAQFEIQDELKVRKVLESNTDWAFEFTKNDRYAPDLELYQWPDGADRPSDRQLHGYVEIERAQNWVTGAVPDGWPYASFLKRKVYDWDYTSQSWLGLKDQYQRTLYLKFNHALDNCFVAPVEIIHRDGYPTKASDGSRTGSFLKLRWDHPDVVTGIHSATEFVDDWLAKKDDDQTSFSDFRGDA